MKKEFLKLKLGPNSIGKMEPRNIKILGFGLGLLVLMILLIAFGLQPYYRDGFRTLSEIQRYAAGLDEFIKMEGKNLGNPSYESYYQKNVTLTLSKRLYENIYYLLSKLNLRKQPSFSVSFFKTILEEVTKARLKQSLDSDFVQKLYVLDSSKIIVFGPVQGAFHSLIRDLTKLNQLGIIDENLKLNSTGYQIVFLGNAINRSPFTLETFALILRLMQNNPENVIYLKGTNEYNNGWKALTLRRELEIRAQLFSKEAIPLDSSVNAFFNTLPLTLYCIMPSSSDIRVPYFQLSPSIDEERLKYLLTDLADKKFLAQRSSEKLASLAINKFGQDREKIDESQVVLKSVVYDIKKRDMYEETDGLRMMQFLYDHSNWAVMSCPTDPFLKAFNFTYDAFVIIDSVSSEKWQISLYNRDIRNKQNKEFNKKAYDLITGEHILEELLGR